ncbi:tetratricopeptide repeat-containing sensor histidine kinase [Patiriisocius marinus]|uniref:tetratricopeptide repeat-containing sensor histidine kinase n=1 Tax=Patiriisocius marinus TaxID=1397112 RepID=UPI00232B6AB0|nr:tetratricopeptide repeat protein [Patiriisocius marinus]
MKRLTSSFLFFLCLIQATLLFPEVGVAQSKNDSLNRYYHKIANESSDTNKLFSAFEFYENFRKRDVKKETEVHRQVSILRNISFIQEKFGLLSESENTIVDALKMLSILKDNDSIKVDTEGALNISLGRLARKKEDYKSAINHYDKALILSRDDATITMINTNKAYLYYRLKDYNVATEKYEVVLQKYLASNDSIRIARALNYLGMSLAKQKLPGALEKIEEALTIRKQVNSDLGIFDSYYNLSEYYRDRNNNKKAVYYINEALKIAIANNNLDLKYNALSSLMKLDKNTYIREFAFLVDSITSVKRDIENQYAEKKYTTDKQKALAQKRGQEAEEYKKQRTIYLLVALLIILLSIGTYFLLKSRHKKNNIVQIYKTETRISKKVHDEVANDIYFLMNKLQSGEVDSIDVLDDLEQLYFKARDISRENNDINTKDNFEETLKFLLLNYRSVHTEVITRGLHKIDWKSISENKKTAAYRVLQELMTNMKKYSEANAVVVRFEQGNNKLIITYKDNGVGTSLKKSNGLTNAENRIHTVGGTIIFESKPTEGFKSVITI